MKYTTVLALLVTSAAALPGKALKNNRGLTKRAVRQQSVPNQRNITHPQYSGNWAGAVQSGQSFTHVEGVITVPQVSGAYGAAASAWVGIDGDACQQALLQTGVSFYADGTFDAWYEWIPEASSSFDNFQLSVGDQIKMVINATGLTTGVATLENLSTGNKVTHTYHSSPSSLCQNSAEWIVEAFMEGSSEVVLANFGEVTFTDASATDSAGTVNGNGATIIDMQDQTGNVLTDCSASGSQVSCTYNGN
ncbi:aspergillopepsin, putative [Metarhizium acridum CQMa 102]|uniref:Aspergillopepsin, putative n=1 Tax=Metarhizium acridum (strain CQMa 102) TaxID=655827 RepID=E9EDD6_METAQ|nr:aspergillopepsin, putative [Metarhizium acridum CQMa 102]EFY86076.1 aspergillopepsin, putative [Metarhizium acridum CQMa 102]